MSLAQKIVVSSLDAGLKLQYWLEKKYPNISYNLLAKSIRQKDIKIVGVKTDLSTILEEGMIIRLPPIFFNQTTKQQTQISLSSKQVKEIEELVIYKDKDILIINKPSGLAVQGGSKLTWHLDALLPALKMGEPEKPKLVHRLDKDTSGALILARNINSARQLTDDFAKHKIQKTYIAFVNGKPKNNEGIIDAPLIKKLISNEEKVVVDEQGQYAKTLYKVLETLGNNISLIAFSPLTGRTHQLRVHASEVLNVAIIGDYKYGYKENNVLESMDNRLYLHAFCVSFNSGLHNKTVVADFDNQFKDLAKKFGFNLPKKELFLS